MMEHTGSQVDNRWMVCLLGGTDVCGALKHNLLPHFPLLHSELVLRH